MRNPPLREYVAAKSTTDRESKGESLRLPLARLLQLITILQSERFPNASQLAEACGVSRRTIYRDLGILDAAGISVHYRPDRQGYELVRGCLLQPIQLEEREALALLIVSRLDCSDDPFGFLRLARSGLAKLVQALPGELRDRIRSSGEMMSDDSTALELPPDRRAIHEAILGALSQRLRLRLWYLTEDSNPLATAYSNRILTTKLNLYRLTRWQGHWSLVGHSSAHREVRLFRLQFVERIEVTDEPYTLPPRFRLDRFLARFKSKSLAEPRENFQLRLSSRVAPEVGDSMHQAGHRHPRGPDGEREVSLGVEVLDEIVVSVLEIGDQVKVLEPEALREIVREWAQRIARIDARRLDLRAAPTETTVEL